MNIDISKLSLQELKALAYDLISQIETSQRNLGAVNAEIAKRKQPVPTGSLLQAVKTED